MKRELLITTALAVVVLALGASAQRPRLGKVCGDPTMKCVGAEDFNPWQLKFAMPKGAVIYRSETFYMIILKSRKLKDGEDCSVVFPENERLPVQELFPKNKVFAMKCFDAGDTSYSNVAYDVVFLGVYGGRTLAEAKAMLEAVKATGKFPGAMIRKTHVEINGT